MRSFTRLLTASAFVVAAMFVAAEVNAQNTLGLPNSIPGPQPSSQDPSLLPRLNDTPGSGIEAERCMVRYINKTKLPAEGQGKLVALNIEEGMTVKKGDVLAVIDDKQSQLALKLKQAELKEAELNAANDINREDAISSQKIAEAEAKSYMELGEKGAAARFEIEKKKLEADRAKLRIELADLQMKTAKAVYIAKRFEVDIAQMDIDMRQVKADFDAYVETRIAQLGEWVQPGTPIAELVQMDELRVEGDVKALKNAGLVTVGTPVKIFITTGVGLDGNTQVYEVDGLIQYVSTELDLNQSYRVWAKIKNQRVGKDWLIKPGMQAKMVIQQPTASSRGANGVF